MSDRNLGQRHRELVESAEYHLVMRLLQFGTSVSILEENYARLDQYLRFLCTDDRADVLIYQRNRQHLNQALIEFTRLLHNYVASAKSLVDHSRRLYRNLYRPHGQMKDYEAQIKTLFASDPLSQFVLGLRGFCQHFEMPPVALQVKVDRDHGETRTLMLSSESLLEDPSWSKPARQYMDENGPELDIGVTMALYHAKVTEFQAWFSARQRLESSSAFEYVQTESVDLALLRIRLELAAAIKQPGMHTIDGMLSGVLDGEELDEAEQASEERRGHVLLDILSRHLPIDGDLKSLMLIAAPYLATRGSFGTVETS